jgi:two-component system alkaline phosphatase synthesis response regulator PhoP
MRVSATVLIIEDEPTLAKLLSYNLTKEGYAVKVADHGETGLNEAMGGSYDLIILDIMLPGINGFDLLRKLRQQRNATPVIILTARTAEEEIVQGLTAGADDYITKPFSVAELFARVQAVLRRAHTGDAVVEPGGSDDNTIAIGNLTIYPERYEVDLEGKTVFLRPKEFGILLYFAERPGVVVTREHLMNAVWGYDYIGGERTIDVHLSSLRKKLDMDRHSVQIESLRGVGYKLIVGTGG